MSVKITIKNLNVSEIEKNTTKEYSKISLDINVSDLIQLIANELGMDSIKLGNCNTKISNF